MIVELSEFKAGLDAWLDENESALAPPEGIEHLDQQMVRLSKVKAAVYDAGWMRWGWPEAVGGLGYDGGCFVFDERVALDPGLRAAADAAATADAAAPAA